MSFQKQIRDQSWQKSPNMEIKTLIKASNDDLTLRRKEDLLVVDKEKNISNKSSP